MNQLNVSIVGLGLIGGSLGLAIKNKTGCRVVGFDRDKAVVNKALELGAIDHGEALVIACVRDADFVFVATPISQVIPTLKKIGRFVKKGAIVTDVASVKTEIVKEAGRLARKRFDFIGGHPMAGKETSGIAVADQNLFINRTWALVPSKKTNPSNLQRLKRLIAVIGGRPVVMKDGEHDEAVSLISHLPFIVSATLFSTAVNNHKWHLARKLAAGGFKDTTRLAGGNSLLHKEIVASNRENIVTGLDGFISELGRVRNLIMSGEVETMGKFFEVTKLNRDGWLKEAGL